MRHITLEEMNAHELADQYECYKRSKAKLLKGWNTMTFDTKNRAQRTLMNIRSQMDRIEILQMGRE